MPNNGVKAILLFAISLSCLMFLASCHEIDNNSFSSSLRSSAQNSTENTSAVATATNHPKHTAKPGYNSYGIPGGAVWRLYDENGALKENYMDIVAQTKKQWGIPEVIIGIPWDERAKTLLIDENGNLVDNWKGIIYDLKIEWGAAD
jgi:hypothetical protein